jgi:DNA adenine methylase
MHISNQLKSFTYLGGKFSVLPWMLPIISVPCNHFVDVFGGSGVVLLNMPPSPIETYNNINGVLVTFFKVLRDMPEALISVLELTPHSKAEYDNAWYDPADSVLETARKFFVRTQQSIYAAGAQEQSKGWTCSLTESRGGISEKTFKWLNSIKGLWKVAARLKTVQIECRDFRFILKHYNDSGVHFYCDEPYHKSQRSNTSYTFDFADKDFFDLKYYAERVKGKISISGYDNDFMRELFKDFTMHLGPQRKNTRSTKEARECLWTNY